VRIHVGCEGGGNRDKDRERDSRGENGNQTYMAAKSGDRALQVVGPILRPYKIAMAVKNGSPLRKRINEALLAIYEDGTYEDIYSKWFSLGK
jgi:ABC-type amino acid transport substrate-binding protein